MNRLIVMILGAIAIAGCDGDGMKVSRTPAMPEVQPSNFTAFVKGQIGTTTETATPADVSSTTFAFPDDNNESAFSDVVAP
jgi:hypothetical protein